MITTRRIHSWEWSSNWCREDGVNLDLLISWTSRFRTPSKIVGVIRSLQAAAARLAGVSRSWEISFDLRVGDFAKASEYSISDLSVK